MIKMVKVEMNGFTEVYRGENGNKQVTCILDENCVRYIVSNNGKMKRRSEFSNTEKEKCFNNAVKVLNK